MISIKLEQLVNSTDALRELSVKPLKAKTALAISRILKVADGEINTFNEARLNLIKKYSEKDENNEMKSDENGNVHIPEENVTEFNTELQDLLNTTIEINANKININDVENIHFTPAEMIQLESFFELDE